MNINQVLDHQEYIRHEVRIAHLEEYKILEWWQYLWHNTKVHIPAIQPIALSSADAACPFIC